MGKTTVKICGLQSTAMLESMIKLPIDHIGFVFAKSKRQVTPEQAGQMIHFLHANLDHPPLTVGVFVNPTELELEQTIRSAPLDVVQLHGVESPAFCEWVRDTLKVKVFKVTSISEHQQENTIESFLDPYAGVIDALMLDTYDPTYGGGSGKTFAWESIPNYLQWARKHGYPLIVAGGLYTDNVAELIKMYNPDGVDVSSGVETNGVKDIDKITNFVERVREIGYS